MSGVTLLLINIYLYLLSGKELANKLMKELKATKLQVHCTTNFIISWKKLQTNLPRLALLNFSYIWYNNYFNINLVANSLIKRQSFEKLHGIFKAPTFGPVYIPQNIYCWNWQNGASSGTVSNIIGKFPHTTSILSGTGQKCKFGTAGQECMACVGYNVFIAELEHIRREAIFSTQRPRKW